MENKIIGSVETMIVSDQLDLFRFLRTKMTTTAIIPPTIRMPRQGRITAPAMMRISPIPMAFIDKLLAWIGAAAWLVNIGFC
jgi:hypothetical protein